MLRLIQEDRELFLIGRRAETQGMGIGAFAYYRRVVEEQKTRIFDKIIDVAKKLGTKDEQIAQLQQDRDSLLRRSELGTTRNGRRKKKLSLL